MRRGTAVSACFVLGVAVLLANGQQPGPSPAKQPEKKADKAAADPVAPLVAAALAHDGDVRMARAKIQLAEAELAKARQQATQKVVTLYAQVEDQKRTVAATRELYTVIEQRVKAGASPTSELVAAREKLEAAQSALARSETELKLLTGGGPVAAGVGTGWEDLNAIHAKGTAWEASCAVCHHPLTPKAAADPNDPAVKKGLEWLGKMQPPTDADRLQQFLYFQRVAEAHRAWTAGNEAKGGTQDRIRAALDKRVTLGAKGQSVTFDKALEVFKAEAGLDVPVRNNFKTTPVDTQGEALPVGAWFQLFADYNPDLRFLVREYGVLVTTKEFAPPDALSVHQFWTTKPAAKADAGAFRVQLRVGGVLTEVETSGLRRAPAEALARAAVKLYHGTDQLDGDTFKERHAKEWEKTLAGDHLLVVLPSRDALGLAPDSDWLAREGAAEVLVPLGKDLTPGPMVYVRVKDKLDLASKIRPDAAKAFTEAMLKAGEAK